MKTDKPLATVIVPAYNAEKYIAHCLDSIIHQTYENVEILVIDDGSSDKTGDIVESMADRDTRIIKIRELVLPETVESEKAMVIIFFGLMRMIMQIRH